MVIHLTTAGEDTDDIGILVDFGEGSEFCLRSEQLVEVFRRVVLIVEHDLRSLLLQAMASK